MPKVSVLMPIYRTNEKYLKEAIESILNQTFTDFEFLILDDCPNDTREDIVKSYKDKRIKYFKNEQNLGITPTRNKLIDMAKGEYLAVFDHDDISLPERLEKQVAYLDEHQDVGVVSCWHKKIPENTIIKNPISNYDIEICLMDDNFITHSACMLRKSVLSDNNIKYNSEYSPAEDYALCVSLIGKTKFHNIPEVLFLYRIHEANTTKTQKKRMIEKKGVIQKIAREQHPDLYQKINFMPYIVRMKLFGIIPLGKFTQIGEKKNILLKCLPFISCKFKREIISLSNEKKLSVIVPVYNEKPEYIERAITSLNNQNFQNLEIILVDDGSKNEDTLNFLNNLKQNNLKIIHKENGGLGSARNLGIQHASGDIIGFLDADDWLEKNFYSKLMDDLTSKKADIACGVLICDGKSLDKFPQYIASTVQKKLKYINNGSVCSKIFKKELFNNIKFPENGIYYEDNPVLLKLLLQANKVSFNPNAKYIYFTNENSITRNKDENKERKRINDSLIILEQIKKWADSYDKKTSDLIINTISEILFFGEQYAKNKFYKQKIDEIFTKEQITFFLKQNLSFVQKIFSVKKAKDKSYKIITILGFQIKIKKIKKYDIIYSIGADCGCAGNLNKFNLRKTSGPFDWLLTASFEERYNLLMNNFDNFLNKKDLEKFEKNPNAKMLDNNCDYYYNRKTNFKFLHDFSANKSLDETFPSVKEKYNRRIKRFIENISNKKHILLVWYSLREHVDYETVLKLHQNYCNKTNKNIKLAIIEHDDTISKDENIEITMLNNNISIYKGNFYDEEQPVYGDYNLCKKVFSNFQLQDDWQFLKKIFFIKKSFNHKIITILGIKIKLKRKKK